MRLAARCWRSRAALSRSRILKGWRNWRNAEIPLPQPFDPLDPDKGLRRLAAKAKRATEREPPSEWLNRSAGTIGALLVFSRDGNAAGICAALDILIELGWGPVIQGLAKRIDAALGSNLAPADLEKLSPAVRRWLAERRAAKKIDDV